MVALINPILNHHKKVNFLVFQSDTVRAGSRKDIKKRNTQSENSKIVSKRNANIGKEDWKRKVITSQRKWYSKLVSRFN